MKMYCLSLALLVLAGTSIVHANDWSQGAGPNHNFQIREPAPVTWIKTDAESKFNFQIHSEGNRASVFRFSTVDSKPGTWTQIKVPLAKLSQPPWSKDGKADLTQVTKIQVTAFQSGPYDGKYIMLDNIVHVRKSE